jgi:uncharacterized protein (TIGR03437 family)
MHYSRTPLLFLLPIVFTGFTQLNAATLVAVNAASLSPGSVAPGAIVSIFGSNLAAGSVRATDAANPPQTLGNVTAVTAGGVPASLFFVSPFQINAVLGTSTPAGNQPLVVTSSTGTQTGTITIDPNAAPGLFSASGTGTGAGAIENALTYQNSAFSVVTSGNATQLSLFATGLNLFVAPTVTIGGTPVTVTFYGKAPCCAGLDQLNVQLPASLAGAGRVPVVLQSGAAVSNVVDIVILPPSGQGEFDNDQDNTNRAREISTLAWIPGTSTALVADENDDVVRVLDTTQKKVTQVITLPNGAQPEGIATNGILAVVAERGLGRVAVINLNSFMVTAQVTVGTGPQAVALYGNEAFVVNQDADTVSAINLSATPPLAVTNTIQVGRGPVAIDATTSSIYVANQDDGTISVINPTTFAVFQTISLGAVRPNSIALANTFGFAFVVNAVDGSIQILNLAGGTLTTGPSTLPKVTTVVVNDSANIAYFADQTGASVSVLPFTNTGVGTLTTIKAGMGVRSLALDTKDKLLLATNEGTGKVTLIDLTTGRVTGSIDAVRSSSNDQDDNNDHDNAVNLPTMTSLSPATGTHGGSSFVLTIVGINLNGATDVIFMQPSDRGDANNGYPGNSAYAQRDKAFTVTNVTVNAAGTQLTAMVSIDNSASPGSRTVMVLTPNGESSSKASSSNTFTVH